MPELVFKGKEYVYNHHLTVPYRPLIAHADKSVGPADLAGNLIIHGDNLHALKSLLPRYAGKVDLVFIDPPYNTGNENWSYNDNVNSPIMKEWLKSNPVNAEDMLRHDKWLCMMWPRLVLLRELLSDRGSFWMTLDDNEVHRARGILDEIFGYENFVATIAWFNKVSPANDATFFSDDHDWIVVYAKDSTVWRPNRLARTAEQEEYYSNPDNDPRGPWNSLTYTSNKTRSERPNLYYEIVNPITMEKVLPPPGSVWRFSVERHRKNEQDNLLYWGKEGKAKVPRYKRFLADTGGVVPRSVWGYGDVGSTQAATLELEAILGLGAFPNAKPTELMERILDIATNEHSVIVDSFAGSGATGHAVLSSNARDRGGRSFVLVECEEYAERVTAERIRKVIAGYATHGIRREELHREGLNWKRIQSAEALVKRVEEVKRKEGFGDTPDLAEQGRTRRFDKINVRIDEGDLVVEGEMRVSERAEGLGGEFTFCTLGEPIDPEGILSGKTLPDFETLGAWLFYTATGATLDKRKVKPKDWYLGEAQNRHLWLVYKPDLGFLKSAEAALTLSLAKKLRERHPDKGHLVFAPAKFLSNKQLLEHGVEYAPLPFALYREG